MCTWQQQLQRISSPLTLSPFHPLLEFITSSVLMVWKWKMIMMKHLQRLIFVYCLDRVFMLRLLRSGLSHYLLLRALFTIFHPQKKFRVRGMISSRVDSLENEMKEEKRKLTVLSNTWAMMSNKKQEFHEEMTLEKITQCYSVVKSIPHNFFLLYKILFLESLSQTPHSQFTTLKSR